MENENITTQKRPFRGIRIAMKIVLWMVVIVASIILLVFLLVQLPYVQNRIKDKVIASLSEKLQTKLEVKNLHLSLGGEIVIEGIFMTDLQHDTLLYADKIRLSFEPTALFHKRIEVIALDLDKVFLNYLISDVSGKTNIDFIFKAFADTVSKPKNTPSVWKVTINRIKLNDARVNYNNKADSITLSLKVGQSIVELPQTDIMLKRYVVKSLFLGNTQGKFTSYAKITGKVKDKQPIVNDSLKNSSKGLVMVTIVKKITIKNSSFIQSDLVTSATGYYSIDSVLIIPDTIDLTKRILAINQLIIYHGIISVKNAKGTAQVKAENGNTAVVDNTAWNISLRNSAVTLDSIEFGNINAEGLGNVLYSPVISLSNFELKANNNFYTSDSWNSNIASLQFLDNKTGQKTYLSLHTSFASGRISAESVKFKTGSSTLNANATAKLSHPVKGTIPDFQLHILSSSLYRDDFAPYISLQSIMHRYSIPNHIELTCNLSSLKQHVEGEGSLITDLGNVTFQTQLFQGVPLTTSTYNVDVKTENLEIGKIMMNPALGPVTANIQVEGEGTDPYTMNASANIVIDAFSQNNRVYRNVQVNGNLMAGDVLINALSDLPDAKLQLTAAGHLSREATNIHLKTSIQNIDLRALGLIKDTMAFSGYISAYYNGTDFNHFNAGADTFQVHIILPEQELNLHNKATYKIKGDTVNAFFDSELFTFTYSGNMHFNEIPKSLGRYLGKFDVANEKKSHLQDSDFFKVDIVLKNLTALETLFPKPLYISEKGNITASMAKGNFTAGADFKSIEYGDYEFEKIKLRINGQDSTLGMDFSIGSVNTPIQLIHDINISGKYNAGLFESRLKFLDEKSNPWFNIAMGGNVKTKERLFTLHDSLLLNYQHWNIPANNKIVVGEKGLTFSDVSLNNSDKQIQFKDNTAHPEELGIEFKNLNMSSISAVWKGDSTAFTGLLSGNANTFHLLDKLQPVVFNAEIALKDITVTKQKVGNLSLRASNTANPDIANIDLNIGRDSMLFSLKGDYGLKKGQPMHFNLNTKNFNIASLAPFTDKFISEPRGYINSSLDISGSTTKPSFSGNVGFKNIYMFVNGPQTAFQVNDQQITFNNNSVNFNSFTIDDDSGNPLVINGSIIVNDFKNIRYDLQIKPNNFLAYNVSAINQPDKKSKALVSGDISVKGLNNFPVVVANLQLDEGSSLYYKVSKHNTNVSSKGIVEFSGAHVAKSEPSSTSIMQNLNLTANISIADGTPFTIITDPARNMGLNLTAGGILSLKQLPAQSPYLSGKVNITGGNYTLAISGLKRTFAISDSSTISWDGNISNPDMNLKAYYTVNTPSAELMGSSDQKYLTAIPFLVNMNIQGQLSQPTFHFQLSLPREYENTYGDVAARLQIINSNETELNQKAIYLLLFGSFGFANFTNIINNGSGGTNALISNALNQFTSQMIRFVDLHFDLQSFDNYGGTTGENLRTQMKVSVAKKFLNQRLSTQLGGTFVLQGDVKEQKKSFFDKIVPEFNVEYTLNKQRTWKVKGFRQSEYRGLVEGKVVSLGTGVVFEKNYDHPRDLFRKKNKKKESFSQILNSKK